MARRSGGSGGSVRVGRTSGGRVGRASPAGESGCVIFASSTGSPQHQAQILLPPIQPPLPNMCAVQGASVQFHQHLSTGEYESTSFFGTAGVSAGGPGLPYEVPADDGSCKGWMYHFYFGPLYVSGMVPMSVVKKFGNQIQDQTVCDDQAPSTPSEVEPQEKGEGEEKAAGKSKPKGVCKVAPKQQHASKNDFKRLGPLPECPWVCRETPIHYGKSIVFTVPVIKSWKIFSGNGRSLVVEWGRRRKDHIENWKKVKAWLRKYK